MQLAQLELGITPAAQSVALPRGADAVCYLCWGKVGEWGRAPLGRSGLGGRQ